MNDKIYERFRKLSSRQKETFAYCLLGLVEHLEEAGILPQVAVKRIEMAISDCEEKEKTALMAAR